MGAFGSMRFNENPNLPSGGTINIQSGGYLFSKIYFNGTSYTTNSQVFTGGADFIAAGTQTLAGTGKIADFGISAATTFNLSGSITNSNWTGIFGKLGGSGSLICPFNTPFLNTGTIAPGLAGIGTLNISRANGVPIKILEMQFTAPANFDQLNIMGSVNLSTATLNLTAPASGVTNGTYPILTWTGTRTGDFQTVNLPLGYSIAYDDAAKKVNLIVAVDCFSLKIQTTKISCNGGSDGSATAKPTGQAAWHTFLWSNNATTQTISGLAAGTYTCTVTRISTGCSHTASATIADPSLLEVEIIATAAKCFGDDNGKLRAKPTGGTGGKTYLWSNGGTTNTIENLAPGNFSVVVTDSKGCTATAAHDLTEPTAIELSHSVETLANGNFTVTLSTIGGTPFPTGSAYRWCREKPDLTCGFLQNPVFSNLAAGSHTFNTRDRFNCQASSTVSLPPSKPTRDRDFSIENFSKKPFQTIENQQFNSSPNPFSETLRLTKNFGRALKPSDDEQLFSVKIYDSAGRLVGERDWSAGSDFLEIETSGLAAGVFFLKIFDEKGFEQATFRSVKN